MGLHLGGFNKGRGGFISGRVSSRHGCIYITGDLKQDKGKFTSGVLKHSRSGFIWEAFQRWRDGFMFGRAGNIRGLCLYL